GGDILVEALGDLVAAENLAHSELRDVHLPDQFARLAVLLAVIDKEILELQPARCRAIAELDLGTERDQGRRRVADRRAIGDIAADRARGPHLFRTNAAQELAKIGIEIGDRLEGTVIGDGSAENETVRLVLDLL